MHMNRLVTLYLLLPLGNLKMQFAVRISIMSLLNTEFAFRISIMLIQLMLPLTAVQVPVAHVFFDFGSYMVSPSSAFADPLASCCIPTNKTPFLTQELQIGSLHRRGWNLCVGDSTCVHRGAEATSSKDIATRKWMPGGENLRSSALMRALNPPGIQQA